MAGDGMPTWAWLGRRGGHEFSHVVRQAAGPTLDAGTADGRSWG